MKILLLLTCLTGTTIDESLSASSLGFSSDKELDNFFLEIIHQKSIHIPTILTMSQQKKSKICEAAVGTLMFVELKTSFIDQITMPNVRDYLENRSDLKKYFTDGNLDNDPICPVSVQELTLYNFDGDEEVPIPDDIYVADNDEDEELLIPDNIYVADKAVQVREMMMECLCAERTIGKYKIKSVFVSYAYIDNTYVVIAPVPDFNELFIMDMIELSPTHVPMSQEELERHYLKYRLPIEKLRQKRPEIAKLTESRGPIESLCKTEGSRLCGSVILSDFYRGKKFTVDKNKNPKLLTKPLAFHTNGLYEEKSLHTHSVVCDCFDENFTAVELLLTQSYNDEDSIFVQREENGKLYLDSYMKDIPVLKQNWKHSQTDVRFDEDFILL